MITWDYRVFHEANGDYIVREVFYDELGAIIGCTADGVEPMGSSFEDLTNDIALFQAALALPILTLADIPTPTNERKPSDQQHNRTLEDVMKELGLDQKLGTHSG